MINIQNLVGGYTNSPIIKGLNLEINKGEFFALLGQNGSGKMLHVIRNDTKNMILHYSWGDAIKQCGYWKPEGREVKIVNPQGQASDESVAVERFLEKQDKDGLLDTD